jgi:hypothetical protein
MREFQRPILWPRASASLLAIGLAALGTSCNDSTTPDPAAAITRDTDALFQTDSLAYTLRAGFNGYDGEIGVTFTNRTTGTVYIVNCLEDTHLYLEKRVDGRWKAAWSPAVRACLSPPITIGIGATYRPRLWIFGGYPNSNTYPQFSIPDIAGEYRAVWVDVMSSYQDQPPFGDRIPIDQRISNRFMLATGKR